MGAEETRTMAASSLRTSPFPEFPQWPFNCLALYTQMARDFSHYAEEMTRCTDAMEAARVEADFGAQIFADLMKGYFDLALAPWTAMASAMAEDVAAPPAASPPSRTRARPH
jgi:hypothetical protein